MSVTRWLILILGPPIIVGASYWLTLGKSAVWPGLDRWEAPVREDRGFAPVGRSHPGHPPLQTACEQKAAEWTAQLGPDCRVVVRCPYVLGGDLSESQLERHYRETIVPTSHALWVSYFDRPPDEPITILLFSNEAAYRKHARRFDGGQQCCYSGYYLRDERRIVLNVATGSGTLAHELTHALAHFDFPEMPEWFDEGLASLHEESEFTADGLRLKGVPNWRGSYVVSAVRRETLRPLESLMEAETVRGESEGLDYAHARYFCLYLQHRGLLAPYYRKLRASNDDPTGLKTLQALLQVESFAEVNRDFRDWVLSVHPTVP